ncbi:tRNA (adenosine(37)-N6)-threonylcarbamoyltransferase complex ATPase subunit type 1 TsaE [Aeoliella mucimassa]|uniref:tRNA threonylcarbamoyladenosine biosynthesis protein TsaE n=1 Tax=Aeoliella mucimassa TaxID=2527972 RepID=A0A518ALI8_9BACT|nr:tRNA (adenosine(37)-N6)-threonylcarbamoyltransferase complex ATPase subunit type 1 TsaE [Aeoliella mucimassa]QDU55592.1 tRNA threonylcarbamoyladenosine biosynthesis protein TsaE [Aeoliella mucimassa]
MTTYTYTSRSLDETDELGRQIAAAAEPGDVLALVGTLGAGKTRLVQAIAVALGNAVESITSPTFVLVNEYTRGKLPLYHFDVYRLKDDDEFLELGAEEYFDRDGVTLIEWGDRVEHLLPERATVITLEIDPNDHRVVTITGSLAARLPA